VRIQLRYSRIVGASTLVLFVILLVGLRIRGFDLFLAVLIGFLPVSAVAWRIAIPCWPPPLEEYESGAISLFRRRH